MDDKSIKMIYHYNCKYKIEKNKDNKYAIYTDKKTKKDYLEYSRNIFEIVKNSENTFTISSYMNQDDAEKIKEICEKTEYEAEKIIKIYDEFKYDNYCIKKKIINIQSEDTGFYINPKRLQEKGVLNLYDDDKYIGTVNDNRSISLLKSIIKNKHIVFFDSGQITIYTFFNIKYFENDFNIYIHNDLDINYIKRLIQNGCKVKGDKVWLFFMDDIREENVENSVILILPENKYATCIIKENTLIIKQIFKPKFSKKGKVSVYIIDKRNLKFEVLTDEIEVSSNFNEYASMKNRTNDFLKTINKYRQMENDILEKNKEESKTLSYSNLKFTDSNLKIDSRGKFFIKSKNLNDLEMWYGKEGSSLCYEDGKRILNIGVLKEIEEDGIIVEFKNDRIKSSIPRKNGKIAISFRGDEVVQKRREIAISALENSTTALRELPDILYGNYRFDNIKYKYILKKQEYDMLNESQIQSVEGSLNTPDIYLIQGPPGTGKTSVIRKIVSELIKRNKEVLVTSYQNLAVDNVLDKFIVTEENVIPYRYGLEDNIVMSKICTDIVNEMELGLENNVSRQIEKHLENNKLYLKKMIQKINSGDDKEFIQNIDEICEWIKENKAYMSSYEDLSYIKCKYNEEASSINNTVKFSIDKVKDMMPNKFEYDLDVMDAFENLKVYINKCNENLNSATLDYVEKEFEKICDVDVFMKLDDSKYQKIKMGIMEELNLVKNIGNKNIDIFKYKTEASELVEKILDNMDDYVEDEDYKIVENFYMKLKSTPILLENVLEKFSDIKGTTCQKTLSKGFVESTKDIDYDYVIVDEVARANSLDLLIPIIKGKKIILVGDHKQLPPLINTEIDRVLRNDEEIEEGLVDRYIKESLFGRLFEEVPYSRKMMLNTQYRMNKQIGDLISELFYNGELKTGIDIKNDFEFYKNQSLVYIDVKGNQLKTESASYKNIQECEAIIQKLEELNSCLEEYKEKVSVGIISFYKAQVQLLKKEIINTRFENLDIQVGTVDSFQGLEKDVIFLSSVRTKGIGFIANPNRLNVSVSRAKKLFVLFGDIDNLKTNSLIKKIIQKCVNGGEE